MITRRKISTAIIAAMVAVPALVATEHATAEQAATDGWPPMTDRAVAKLTADSYPIDVYDPMEPFNRRSYVFNAKLDRYVFLPVTEAYTTVTPDFVEDRVSNFFNNLDEITNFANSVLQLKPASAGTALGRFVTNTTVGLAGTFDVASEAGLEAAPEDFGQTLATYGVPQGAYIVLPALGPSTARDATGLAFDAALFYLIDPFNFEDHSERGWIYGSAKAIDSRANNEFRYYQTGSPFEYELIRFMYTAKRNLEAER